jgi:regulator of sigma D
MEKSTAFKQKDYDFIKKEFGFSKDELTSFDDAQMQGLYDELREIEIDETMKHIDEELSERGKMAVRLVDLIHGPYDSTEFDEEMRETQ